MRIAGQGKETRNDSITPTHRIICQASGNLPSYRSVSSCRLYWRCGLTPKNVLTGLCLIAGLAGSATRADDQKTLQESVIDSAGHMYMTALEPQKPGDQQKADAVVVAARAAMAPYADYHKALADGYEIFLPNIQQPQYHFTNRQNGLDARQQFDPSKPTSLLYKKTADGYALVGAMYTDRVGATQEELNERIPLSIARWHQHINFCKAPDGQKAAYFGPTPSLDWLGQSPPGKRVKKLAENSFRISLAGWFTSIPTKRTPRKFGGRMMTIKDTTTWTTRQCPG